MFHVEHLEMNFNFKKESSFPPVNWRAIGSRLWRGSDFSYCEILKLTLLVSGPEGVVTTTGPVVAPERTTAVK